MKSVQQEIDERTNLTGSNKFELLLFTLGPSADSDRAELFGINVFKIREIVAMPEITSVAGAPANMLGVVNLRGQIISVIDLPAIAGCTPKTGPEYHTGDGIRAQHASLAVESVEDIARLDWSQVLSAESSAAGGMVTSIARLDGDTDHTRLVQVLDVESILRNMMPPDEVEVNPETLGPQITLKPGTVIWPPMIQSWRAP
jgi:Chemotaxis signal transduction protein